LTGATGVRRSRLAALPRPSDRSLGAGAALLIAAALLTGCGGNDTPREEPRSAPTPSAAAASPQGSPQSSDPATPGLPRASSEPAGTDHAVPDTAPAPPPTTRAAQVATRFAAAWARPALPADRWWTEIAPWCEPRFADLLRSVDPANIPARRVTGPPRPAITKPGLITYTVPTEAGLLTVTVAALGGTWLVTNNDFRRAGR